MNGTTNESYRIAKKSATKKSLKATINPSHLNSSTHDTCQPSARAVDFQILFLLSRRRRSLFLPTNTKTQTLSLSLSLLSLLHPSYSICFAHPLCSLQWEFKFRGTPNGD